MTSNAIVVGAGITGIAAAEWLRRGGVRVTLIDRVAPGAPEQASYGNAGVFARSAIIPLTEPGLLAKAPRMLFDPDSPLFVRWSYLPRLLPWLVPFLRNARADQFARIVRNLHMLTDDSVDQHQALAMGTGAEKYIKTGDYAFYFRDRKAFLKDRAGMDMRKNLGFEMTEVAGDALHRRDPQLGTRYNFAAVFGDHGWLTSPGNYVAALGRHYVEQGGMFRQGAVADITDDGVTLSDGHRLTADRIILAAGAWSGALAGKLGQRPMLETERGYHLFLKNPSYLPAHPFMVSDAKFVVTPMADGLRCAGIVEFGGLHAPPSAAPTALLRKRIRQVYPGLTWQSEETWMGHRPTTPDCLPHIGPLAHAPNVICAYGAQHIGLTVGPRIGRLVAEMAMGRRINQDLTAFSPDRFA